MSDKDIIIVSACLAGIECRYDCAHKKNADIEKLVTEGRALPLCPEQLGGLPTPRPPAENVKGRYLTKDGEDVTEQYQKGAKEGLKLALMSKAKKALLKGKSPMCGCGKIYDGSFSGTLTSADGEFCKVLKENGIEVEEID